VQAFSVSITEGGEWTGLDSPVRSGYVLQQQTSTCFVFSFAGTRKNSALLAICIVRCCLRGGLEQVADTGVKNYPVRPALTLPFRHSNFVMSRGTARRSKSRTPFIVCGRSRAGCATGANGDLRFDVDTRRAVAPCSRPASPRSAVMEFVIKRAGRLNRTKLRPRFGEALPQLITVRRD